MGYDVHITRAESWLDAAQQPILLDEWLAYLAIDTEMRLDGVAAASTALGEALRYANPGLSVWIAHPSGSDHTWFDLQQGEIVVKNPDLETRRKMFRIAVHFKARVQGDDGEEYWIDGNPTGQ